MSPSNRVNVGSCLTGARFNRIERLPWRCLRPAGHRDRPRRPWIVVLGALLALLLMPRLASAYGTVTCLTPSPQEEEGRWDLSFNFDYGRVPDMPHIPMMFSFQHVVQYEWSLTDESPNKPIFTRKPLNNQPEINISTDVGFADAAGKIWRSTKKYRIQVRRDAEFESGEYMLTIREDGRVFGRPIRITLRGENEPVDRRAINIEAPRPPPKKPKKDEPTKGTNAGDDSSEGDDMLAQLDEELSSRDTSLDEPEGPPAEKPRQGGCGCAVPGQSRFGSWPGLVVGLGLGLLLDRRLRRRRR